MKIALSFDIEPDLHSGGYKGITEGIPRILNVLDKNGVKGTFFVTCDCIEKYPDIFKKLVIRGHEVSLHAYRHERFDGLSIYEKEEQIKKALACFRKYLNIKPTGFRAPQGSIDEATLNLLEKYGFIYDSSYNPLNFLQLLFFPEKIGLWFKTCFSRLNPYKIRKNLIEIPPSAVVLPFVSLMVRAFPRWLERIHVGIISIFFKNPIFYAHSWDFIELKKSRIDRTFSHERFIRNLDYLIGKLVKSNKFIRIGDLA